MNEPLDTLPEWWRSPRWLAAPKKKPARREPVTAREVKVPFVMEADARARALAVLPAHGLIYTHEPTVFIGAVADLPLPDAMRARWGSHPFWFVRQELENASTLFEKHPESAESVQASAGVLSTIAKLPAPAIFSLIESHIGTTDSLVSGFHAELDVPTAIGAFEADGFRIVRLTAWPPQRGPARPHGDARFVRGLTDPSSQFYGGAVDEVEHRDDGTTRHTRLGNLDAIFDAMSDEALSGVLPKLPNKAGDVAAARYLAARFGGTAHESEALTSAARIGGLDALEAFAAEGIASTALALPYAEALGKKRLAVPARRWLRMHVPHAVAG